MIITKSVSRFARNFLNCIGWVRTLKDRHDPPIADFFEQEHLNTLDNTSNIILFVLAMVAEEESHMKSEAIIDGHAHFLCMAVYDNRRWLDQLPAQHPIVFGSGKTYNPSRF